MPPVSTSGPLHRRVEPVAGHAGCLLDDRDPTAEEPVEQGGLPYVGTANEGDDLRRTHGTVGFDAAWSAASARQGRRREAANRRRMRAMWNVLSFVCLLWWAPAPAASPPQPQPAATIGPHGGAYVTTLPAGASAWLDGEYVGETPVYVDDLFPGDHSLTLSRAGWQPETTTFSIDIGSVTPVSVVMRRVQVSSGAPSALAKGQGTLAILGAPAGARIYIDGAAAGTSPLDPRSIEAGYHIVTLEPASIGAPRAMRIVDVYPETTTVVQFSAASSLAQTPAGDDVLEPLDSVVPGSDVIIAGDVITIHHQGMEVECAIGSRSYTFNGRAGTLSVPPALVGSRIYLPRSLMLRLGGK
jgi:hypothetical protein